MEPIWFVLAYLIIGMGLMLFGVCGVMVYNPDRVLNRPLSIILTSLLWLPLIVVSFLTDDEDEY